MSVVIGRPAYRVEEALFLTNCAAQGTSSPAASFPPAEKILQERLFKNPKDLVIWTRSCTTCWAMKSAQGDGRRVENRRHRRVTQLPPTASSRIGHSRATELVADKLDSRPSGLRQDRTLSTATSGAGRVRGATSPTMSIARR